MVFFNFLSCDICWEHFMWIATVSAHYYQSIHFHLPFLYVMQQWFDKWSCSLTSRLNRVSSLPVVYYRSLYPCICYEFMTSILYIQLWYCMICCVLPKCLKMWLIGYQTRQNVDFSQSTIQSLHLLLDSFIQDIDSY